MLYGVATDDDYTSTHKRERLTIWSGAFMSDYEGEAYSLPRGDGYMVVRRNGERVRVACPTPRDTLTWQRVDGAINAALNPVEVGARVRVSAHPENRHNGRTGLVVARHDKATWIVSLDGEQAGRVLVSGSQLSVV